MRFSRKTRRFLIVFCAIVILGLGGIATFNLLIDPHGVYGIGAPTLENYKPDGSSRITKAAALRRGHWDTLLLGSSLAEVGIDPRSPLWRGERVYNCGLISTNMFEIKIAFDYAMKHNDLRQVYLIVSERMFDPKLTVDRDFSLSEFNGDLLPLDYHANLLFGYLALIRSLDTLRAFQNDQLAVTDRFGFRRSKGRFGQQSPARLFASIITARIRNLRFWRDFNGGGQRMAHLDQLAERCRNEGISLTVVIPPCHAMLLELIHHRGNWENYETWKRELVHRAESPNGFVLWDFSGCYLPYSADAPQTPDAETKWFWDSLHFKSALGELVLGRIIDGTNQDFGVQLNPLNIEEHLESLRRRQADYRRDYPDQVRWLRQLLQPRRSRR